MSSSLVDVSNNNVLASGLERVSVNNSFEDIRMNTDVDRQSILSSEHPNPMR